MNKFVSAVLLCLLFAACQNTPKNASENTATAPTPAAPVAAPEAIQQASASLTTGVKMMEDLRKQVDALPANVRKAKAAEIDGMYSTLEGMIEKQTGMLNEINAASAPATNPKAASQENSAPPVLSPAQVQEYNESAARYVKEAEAMQEMLAKMAAGK